MDTSSQMLNKQLQIDNSLFNSSIWFAYWAMVSLAGYIKI